MINYLSTYLSTQLSVQPPTHFSTQPLSHLSVQPLIQSSNQHLIQLPVQYPIQQLLSIFMAALIMLAVLGLMVFISNQQSLNGIKSKTVGDGQHGTARFATEKEIRQTYAHVPYEPEKWRQGKNLPTRQGLVVGYKQSNWGKAVQSITERGV